MNKMKIEILVLGPVQTNCYLIQNCETKEILVVDPADRESRIRQKAEEMGGQIRAILLTHGHFDHITAAEELRRETEAPVYAFKEEAILLADTEYNLSAGWASPVSLRADVLVGDKEELSLARSEERRVGKECRL